MSKTKEEILDSIVVDGTGIEVTQYEALKAMDSWAEQQSIEFFKWYATKITGLIEYITDIRPRVRSEEIEVKIVEFEGKPLSTLYKLFLNDQNK